MDRAAPQVNPHPVVHIPELLKQAGHHKSGPVAQRFQRIQEILPEQCPVCNIVAVHGNGQAAFKYYLCGLGVQICIEFHERPGQDEVAGAAHKGDTPHLFLAQLRECTD